MRSQTEGLLGVGGKPQTEGLLGVGFYPRYEGREDYLKEE
jgi:hypothetical protein